MRLASIPALALAVALSACGGGEEPAPTHAAPLPDAGTLIPVAPAPQPTPTPTPGAAPEDPSPWPAIPGGGGSGGGGGATSGSCGEPEPPAVSRFRVSVHSMNGDRMTLDSTPLVGPDIEYCRRIGYTDGRSFCPVRPEGHPEREACEAARVGPASDTGRVGPTWSVDGRRCDGEGASGSCQNHSSNQFLAYAWGKGTFRACAASGACGDLTIP